LGFDLGRRSRVPAWRGLEPGGACCQGPDGAIAQAVPSGGA